MIVCDHVEQIPRRLGSLGLGLDDLATHIASIRARRRWRGALRSLDAPLVLSGYSRLVVDCNRPLNGVEVDCRRKWRHTRAR